MAKPSAGKTATVTLKQLAAEIAEKHDLKKKQSEALLDGFVDLVAKNLKQGERIRIAGFGVLRVSHRAARTGRNPATGEPIKIEAKRKVTFRPAADLKQILLGGGSQRWPPR